uniref:Uncharacterized protein n=1 Tax=Rhizophora mucronata TaxID=61149 RepID=A0A2P2N4R3_RHIMU
MPTNLNLVPTCPQKVAEIRQIRRKPNTQSSSSIARRALL